MIKKQTVTKITTLIDTLNANKNNKESIIYCNNLTDEITSDYHQLYNQALQMLAQLKKHGFNQGDQLIFQIENFQSFLITFWGCILGGIVPIPISVGPKDDSLKKVFSVWDVLDNPTLCVDSITLLNNLKKYAKHSGLQAEFDKMQSTVLDLSTISILNDKKAGKNLERNICNVNPDDTAFIQFSSGSTGNPKGIVLTHANLVANIKAISDASETTKKDVMVSWMPLTHDMGLIGVHLTGTIQGIKQVLIDTRVFVRKPSIWLNKVSQHRGSMLYTPNYGLNILMLSIRNRKPDWDLSSVRVILNGAEPISLTLAYDFLDILAPYGLNRLSMFPVYGLAEASVGVSFPKPGSPMVAHYLDRKQLNFSEKIVHVDVQHPDAITFIEVGTAINECAVKIADETGSDIDDSHIGLIYIKGANVTSGYFANEAETRKVLGPDGWLNTGDLGFIKNGQLTITGRAKDMIIINGQNIYAHDIEQVCTRLPEVLLRNVVACSYKDENSQIEQLLIFIRYKKSLTDFIDLTDLIRRHLQKEMSLTVAAIIPIKDIPKTTSGKVKRFALQKNYGDGHFQSILNQINLLEKETQTNSDHGEIVHKQLQASLTTILGYQLKNDDDKLSDHGIDSLKAVELHSMLQSALNIDIPISSIFDYPTLSQLETFLLSQINEQDKLPTAQLSEKHPKTSKPSTQDNAVAVIGFSCHFPGSKQSNEGFYNNLYEGRELNSTVPSNRWSSDLYNDRKNLQGTMKAQKGYFLDQVDMFDASFFGITPIEAKEMDPQQRLLLTLSQQAIDNAGIKNESLNGSKTSVYIGMANSDFAHQSFGKNRIGQLQAHSLTGSIASTASGRISYFYGLNGPCLTLDTACSSSLVAIDLARTSLLTGQADQALVGGVNLILTPQGHVSLSKVNALSPDGKCKVFDDAADGYGRGEGCAVLVLKRLSDAQRDGDVIRAVIASSAVNHDGKSSGLTVPNGLAQQQVINTAMEQAGLVADDINYIEAHGTGTKLGDPQEITALSQIFKKRASNNPLPVGSVKSNIGHLEGAAGIAGVIKLILSMEQGIVPKNLHLTNPNNLIPWSKIPLRPLSEHLQFDNSQQLSCGISSFGLGGTNAHLIIQNYPAVESTYADSDKASVLILSAKTPASLRHCQDNYITFLSNSQHSARDIAYASQRIHQDYPYRLAVVGQNKTALLAQLKRYKEHTAATETKGNIAFIFTGQGSQYIDIAKDLNQTFAVFNAALTDCAKQFAPYLEKSIEAVIYQDDAEQINNTLYAQPVIFSIGYALIKLLEDFGIKPQYVLGHSIGQYTAAYAAGVLTLPDAVRLVANRAILMSKVKTQGSMLAVTAPANEIRTLVEKNHPGISIAAINSPLDITLSGSNQDINSIIDALTEMGIPFRELKVSNAFHSPLMQSVLEPFSQIIDEITLHPPKIPIVSDLTGQLTTPGKPSEITSKNYWLKHIVNTITFSDGLETLSQHGCHAFVEIGGSATLSAFAVKTLQSHKNLLNVATMRGSRKSSLDTFYQALSDLYVNHYPVDWQAMVSHQSGSIVDLPNYGFEQTTFPIHPEGSDIIEVNTVKANAHIAEQNTSTVDKTSIDIKTKLAELIESISGITLNSQLQQHDFLALGLDSLMLTRLKTAIEENFDISIALPNFYDKYNSADKLTAFVANHSTTISRQQAQTQTQTLSDQKQMMPAPTASNVAEILSLQLQTFQTVCQAQLAHLNGNNVLVTPQVQLDQTAPTQIMSPAVRTDFPTVNFRLAKFTDDELSTQQQKFVTQLIKRHNFKTAGSKTFSQSNKDDFAHYLTTINFRKTLKELLYPLVAEYAKGSHFWDIDNNKYIDLAIGYGVHFFGHKPDFVIEAVREQMDQGFVLSPHPQLLGDVTALIKQITGVERVSYCNTGSEAVMLALRIARTRTKRTKIVKFSGSYHGIYDGILVESDDQGSYPTTPGITPASVQDTIVLTYDDPKALEVIEQMGSELAAVLVEPVQSRNPSLQPKAFLKKLREITKASGTALIFDEIITGFRLQPGGAQAFFDIRADLVTYGKIIGGGLPIGIIAGTRHFMDAVDGGKWQYQDDSVPQTEATFIAGTFANHPMALAAAKSVLLEIKNKGQALYDQTNALTLSLVNQLNDHFAANQVPIKIKICGPIFRFESFGRYALALQPLEMDILFYLMMLRGVYTWERRICFMSTAHTTEDINHIVKAVIDSVAELRAGGFSFTTGTPTLPPGSGKKKASLMSSAQKRLFTLNSINGAEKAYHLSYMANVKGDFDISRAEKALCMISSRHESLRTTFELLDGEFTRLVHTKLDPCLEQVKATKKSLAHDIENFFRPFDLQQDAMLRAKLISLTPNESVFILDLHHIAADGYSANILFQEFISIYQEGENSALTITSPVQFKEFVDWESEYLTGSKYSQDYQFWKNYLAGHQETPQLPMDHPRPKRQTFNGKTHTFTLSTEQTSQLIAIAKQLNVTLYMLLLSGYHLLLSRLTNNANTIVGAPVALRQPKGFEQVVGMLTNTIVYRNHIDDQQTFDTLVQNVKQNCIEVYAHQELPFEQLVKLTGIRRDMSRNPLFDVNFVFERADDRVINITGLEFTPQILKQSGNVYDFSFEVIEQKQSLTINLHYNDNLFDTASIVRWAALTQELINNILHSPQQRLSDILPIAQHEQCDNEHVATQIGWEHCDNLMQRFQKVVEHFGDNNAFKYQQNVVTYAQLDKATNQLAHMLRHKYDIAPTDRIAIQVDNSASLIHALICVFKLGCAYIPIQPNIPSERVTFILKDSGAKLLLTESHMTTADFNNRCDLDLVNIDEFNDSPLSVSVKASDLAYIIYTSGTTGQPKGVRIGHHSLVNYFTWFTNKYQIGSNDSSILLSCYSFDLGYTSLWGCLMSGGCLHLMDQSDRKDMKTILHYIAKEQLTFVKMTPSLFQVLVNHQDFTPDLDLSLRLILLGGELLRDNDIQKYFNNYKDTLFVNHYGPTEATIGCITHDITATNFQQYREKRCIGQAISNNQVHILDNNSLLVSEGDEGEICIEGDSLALGYVNSNELEQRKFIDSPVNPGMLLLKTGDSGCIIDGQVSITGRLDDQAKIRGYRVEPGEVSSTLEQHPDIARAAVVTRKTNSGNELIAYYESEGQENNQINIKLLRVFMMANLPDYMCPSHFIYVTHFPTNANGKLDIKKLLEKNTVPVKVSSVAGARELTPSQQEIFNIWQQHLSVPTMTTSDDFFELGGHSLTAMLISAALSKKFDTQVSINEIFEYSNIEALDQWLGNNNKQSLPPIMPVKEQDLYPLSSAQKRLWLVSQVKEQSIAYNVHAAFLLAGQLNIELLNNAFTQLVNRHESLRTNFNFAKGEPQQQIHDNIKFAVKLIEPETHINADDDSLKQIYLDESQYHFDLKNDVLFRVTVVKVSAKNKPAHVLIFNSHHIICDGWSNSIILQEVCGLYDAYNKKQQPKLEPLTIQYKDYAAWHNNMLSSDQAMSDKTFWLDQLAEIKKPMLLPGASTQRQYNGDWYRATIEETTGKKMQEYCQNNGVSLYTFFASITGLLMSQYCATDDVIFATPLADRQLPQLQSQVGFYLNTFLLRQKINPAESFSNLLNNNKTKVNKVMQHSLYPVELVLDDVDLSEGNVGDFYRVILNVMEYQSYSNYKIDGLSFNKILETATTSRADLNIMLVKGEQLELVIEYNSQLLDESEVKTIKEQLVQLTSMVIEQPEISIKELKQCLVSHEAQQAEHDFLNASMAINDEF